MSIVSLTSDLPNDNIYFQHRTTMPMPTKLFRMEPKIGKAAHLKQNQKTIIRIVVSKKQKTIIRIVV